MNTIKQLRKALLQCRPLAVVGLSVRWHRLIFFAAKYLQAQPYRVVPVNPRYAKASMLVWAGAGSCAAVVTNDDLFAMDTNGLIHMSANR